MCQASAKIAIGGPSVVSVPPLAVHGKKKFTGVIWCPAQAESCSDPDSDVCTANSYDESMLSAFFDLAHLHGRFSGRGG